MSLRVYALYGNSRPIFVLLILVWLSLVAICCVRALPWMRLNDI